MDPISYSPAPSSTSAPRRRGDGPPTGTESKPTHGCSPQARGWTGDLFVYLAPHRVFPAGAGMDRASPRSERAVFSVPRRRGDGPGPTAGVVQSLGCSPQARGWTWRFLVSKCVVAVFPAGAGMDHPERLLATLWLCAPRRRGDGPSLFLSLPTPASCSPQARGWTIPPVAPAPHSPVLPAGAGMGRGGPVLGAFQTAGCLRARIMQWSSGSRALCMSSRVSHWMWSVRAPWSQARAASTTRRSLPSPDPWTRVRFPSRGVMP